MSYAWREFCEFFKFWLPPIAIIVGGLSILAAFLFTMDYYQCQGFSNATGRSVRYSWGCYVEVQGEYVPKEYVYGKAHELRHK
jgi:hypothetical protein